MKSLSLKSQIKMNHKNVEVNHRNLKSKKYLYLKSFFYESEQQMKDVVNEDMFEKEIEMHSNISINKNSQYFL